MQQEIVGIATLGRCGSYVACQETLGNVVDPRPMSVDSVLVARMSHPATSTNIKAIPMNAQELDMDARYRVKDWPGVAVWLAGWEQRWEPMQICFEDEDGEEVLIDDPYGEGEWIDDPDKERVLVVMVGDDRRHLVDVADLIPIEDEDYCHVCGQLGCGHS